MRRVSGFWTFALGAALCLTAACFGDNSDGDGGELPDGKPAIVEITGAEELDLGDSAEISVKLKGKANEQLSVAVDATLGALTPQSKVVITDDNGDAVFVTSYTSGATAGTETITANVSALGTTGTSLTKTLTIFDVERLGIVSPIATVTPEVLNYLIVYPFEVSTERTLRKVAIVAPEATAAQIGLYSSSAGDAMTARPVDALLRTTANLAVGANEIAVSPLQLPAGRYWMAVAYPNTPMVRKESPPVNVTIYGWRITTYSYAGGLPAKLDTLVTSTTLSYRNFYLVLRK